MTEIEEKLIAAYQKMHPTIATGEDVKKVVHAAKQGSKKEPTRISGRRRKVS